MNVRSASSMAIQPLISLSPFVRRVLLIGIDAILLPLAVWLSFWLRLAHQFYPNFIAAGSWLMVSTLLVGLPLYAFTGLQGLLAMWAALLYTI